MTLGCSQAHINAVRPSQCCRPAVLRGWQLLGSGWNYATCGIQQKLC